MYIYIHALTSATVHNIFIRIVLIVFISVHILLVLVVYELILVYSKYLVL